MNIEPWTLPLLAVPVVVACLRERKVYPTQAKASGRDWQPSVDTQTAYDWAKHGW